MTHWQRALLAFAMVPIGFVALVIFHDWAGHLLRNTWIMERHWWDPWVGGFLMVLFLALVCWRLTE